jgi:hypothetical protein
MSISTRSPLRVAGGNVNSGNVYTGEQNFTLGGGQSATIFSGMVSGVLINGAGVVPNTTSQGADVQFYSGAGRLKDVLVLTPSAISGGRVIFYDAGVATSGGPFAASGHKIVGQIPQGFGFGPGGTSGVPLVGGGQALGFDFVFNSGLCANMVSGAPGFTVTWTPETNPQAPFIG